MAFDPRSGDEVVHAVDRAKQRRLSAARRADQGCDAMSRDVDGDVLHRSERPVVGADVLEPDDGRKGRGRSVGRPRDIEVDRRSLFGLDEIWRGRGGHQLSEGCWIRVGGFWPLIRHHRRSYRLRRMIAKAFAITVTSEQHDDRRGRQRPEFLLRLARPVEDDDRKCGVRPEEQVLDGTTLVRTNRGRRRPG